MSENLNPVESNESLEFLKGIVSGALAAAFRRVQELGYDGRNESPRVNQHGEKSLIGDVEAKEAVIDYLKGQGLPVVIYSEEHEIQPLSPLSEQKKIVAYLDSLSEKVKDLKKLQLETAADLSALSQSILHQAFKGKL